MRRLIAAAVVVLSSLAAGPARAQSPAGDCADPQDCRARALEAREARQYERFHDLAWRAIQTGKPNDPDLMYLLARAQALSGRRRDALVILRRLADMGVATEAATEEDLRRVRELPGWSVLEARFEELRAGGAAPRTADAAAPSSPPADAPAPAAPGAPPAASAAPSSAATAPASGADALPLRAPREEPGGSPAAPPAAAGRNAPAAAPERAAAAVVRNPAPPVVITEPLPSTDVAQFSTASFSPAGLAYDEVSRRFLFGDTLGRRLFVVGEGSTNTVDLVRGDSAGFHDVTALEIGRRGDLWVTSTAADGTTAAIHRLQLISGRALGTFETPGDGPVSLADLSVAANGTVLALDRRAGRVLRLRNGAKEIETAMPLELSEPVSLTAADGERSIYVAHADGVARVDLQRKSVNAVTAPEGVQLSRFERIRWHRNSLVGIQRQPDGSRALVILQLDRAGGRAVSARIVDPAIEGTTTAPLLTIVGDDVYYSVLDTPLAAGATVDVRVRRISIP